MQSRITIRGYIGKIQEGNVRGKKCVFINLATNIYNYGKENIQLDETIWSRFIYYGNYSNIKVGMPIVIDGHMSPNKGRSKEFRSFNLVADHLSLDLESEKAVKYLKDEI